MFLENEVGLLWLALMTYQKQKLMCLAALCHELACWNCNNTSSMSMGGNSDVKIIQWYTYIWSDVELGLEIIKIKIPKCLPILACPRVRHPWQ
jgi:hypothetical protein